jgi:hypothetical protein
VPFHRVGSGFPQPTKNTEQDLEILLLRRQVDILERKLTYPLPVSQVEKWTPAVLLVQVKRRTGKTSITYAL